MPRRSGKPSPSAVAAALSASAPDPRSDLSASAKAAALAAILLLAEIIKAPWYRRSNHFALYQISVIASVYALQFADAKKRLTMVRQYSQVALEHCSELISEAKERNFHPDEIWAEVEPLSEFDVMWERRRLVADCGATLVLANGASPPFDRAYVRQLIEATCNAPRVWGLAPVASLIVRTWARRRLNSTSAVESTLAQHASKLMEINLERDSNRPPLASPYYSFEDVWADSMGMPFFTDNNFGQDTFRRRAWFMRAIVFMLAKRNLKQTCRALWPKFSRLIHEEPELPHSAFFSPALSEEGRMTSQAYHQATWSDLVRSAVDAGNVPSLDPFKDLAWLLAAYTALVPYRGTTPVLMWLDARLNSTWYHAGHLPGP